MVLNHTPLPLYILHDLWGQCTLLRKTQLSSECCVRDPATGVPRCSLLQHLIHLLEGKTLGFWDEEIGVDEAGGAESAPEEEDFGTEVAFVCTDEVGGDDGDDLLRLLVFWFHAGKYDG